MHAVKYLEIFIRLFRKLKNISHWFLILIATFSLQLITSTVYASDWYKDYGLKKSEVFSEKFNSTVTIYQTSNDLFKPSITLIHGVGGSAEDFKDLVAGLSLQYKLLLLDLPGFGLSKSHENIFSPKKYATLLIDLLPPLINNTNYIIGHSMGGNVSVQIALKAPNLADKLILIDAAGFLNKFSYSKHIAANYVNHNIPLAERYSSKIKSAISFLNQLIPDPTKPLLSSVGRETILKNNINYISAIAVMDEELSTLIRKKAPPTLIIWGKKDQVMPYQVSSMLSYLLKTESVFLLPDAGHSPQKQYPNQIIKEINAFIKEDNYLAPTKINQSAQNITINCDNNDSLSILNNAQFSKVTINNCNQNQVKNLHATSITLNNSMITFNHLRVSNIDGYTLLLKNSDIEIWGGNLNAQTIAYIYNSQLEFNGVELNATNSLVISNLPTTVNASLTKVNVKNVVSDWHGFIDVGL